MAKLIDNIRRVHDGFAENNKNSILLETLKEHGIAAMIGGIKSPEARKYMSMFAHNEQQLTLLTNTDEVASMPWLHETQAYLMSNSICTPITNGKTGSGIFDKAGEVGLNALDAQGLLSTAVEATVVNERPDAFKQLFPQNE